MGPKRWSTLGDAGSTRRRRNAVGPLRHRRGSGGARQRSRTRNRAAGKAGVLRRRKRVVGSVRIRRRRRGPGPAAVTSPPHSFGAQVEWSRRLGGVPVYVNAADAEWVMRPDPAIQLWSDTLALTPSLTVVRVGGHFPGSSVACWTDGADGRGVLLTGDTIFPNPDRRTVGFLRSYPNHLPLSAAVVQRMAATLAPLHFDRIYGLFTNAIDSDGHAVVQRSAQRHAAWVRGDYDHLT